MFLHHDYDTTISQYLMENDDDRKSSAFDMIAPMLDLHHRLKPTEFASWQSFSTFTLSPISQSRSVRPAAIAGMKCAHLWAGRGRFKTARSGTSDWKVQARRRL